MSSGPAVHLAKYMHDVVIQVTEIWCDAEGWSQNVTEHVEAATCLACLNQAALFGNDCRRRYRNLLNRTKP